VTDYAFVIADLAGYTALTEAHGGAGAARTVARYAELASKALTQGARLTERVGDQVLIVAGDACSAVSTALRLRDSVDREPLFLGVRIGIDSGPAVEEAGRYFGSALNIAARVAAHARGGQILCTAHVAPAVRVVPDVRCIPLGAVRFRNVPEPVELFEVASTINSGGVVDPVCRMHVEAATAPARLPFEDTTYYFCSFQCAEAFAGHPRAYV
jgi:class 3 adenylate cyclase/YHS domain-containing protein